MHRRQLAGICLAGFAGCLSGDQSSGEGRKFSDFTVINDTQEEQKISLRVERNGKQVMNDDIRIPAEGVRQLIDNIEDRTGDFAVHISRGDEEKSISVTEKASTENYYLFVEITETDIALFTSAKNKNPD